MVKMGYCGDVCDHCPRFLATKDGRIRKLREVAELWHRVGLRPETLPPEEMVCHGCSPSKMCPYGIAPCASEREIASCGECADYPCDRISVPFERIEVWSQRSRQFCTSEEYELVPKAFFEKKRNLDRIHEKHVTNRRSRTHN